MTSPKIDSPQLICEEILRDEKRYNINHDVLPAETIIVDRLLRHGVALSEVYIELHGKLGHRPCALQAFLGQVLSTAAFWSLEQISEARNARDDLKVVNQQIASKAAELAELLQQRESIHNTSEFSSNTHYHVCHVLRAAASGNQLFKSYVQKSFGQLSSQFDLKYWPTLTDFLSELASDAERAVPEASDPLTEAATSAQRSSLADFFKALFAAIDENSVRNHGRLPNDFRLTDNTLATLVNCALDLEPDELVDGVYVKRIRQRERERAREG
ncbi:hypothetical protein ACWYXK_06820 [Janthinobacterium lividum]